MNIKHKLLLLFILFFFFVISLVQHNVFFVKTSSMEPTIPKYSLIIVSSENYYQIGDIITYKMHNSSKIITHRINDIHDSESVHFRTKGDKNINEDPYIVKPSEIVGKVTVVIKKSLMLVIAFICSGYTIGKSIKYLKIPS